MINWDEIVSEIGIANVIKFGYGRMSKRQFGRLGTNVRRACDNTPINRLKILAKEAARRRTTKAQRFAVLNEKSLT